MDEILEFKERKNTHQTHFEDLVLLGEDGLNELNDKIEKFMATLGGQDVGLNTTTKIDGAPAVICWSKFEGYPDNSICLKSFVTSNKNALSSVEDIQAKYGDRPDMAEKLMYCLELAKCIPANEAWQGDCLYSKGDLKEVEIKGTNYLTFHPNKIIYAFSEDNPTYNTIKNSSFGICFHTIYKAANEGKKTQSFRVDAKRLNNVPENIYVMSPALNKSNNKADYNMEEVNKQFDELKQLEKQLLSNSDYEDLCDNSVFMGYWNTFENANLSDKRAVNIDLNTFFDDLKAYIKEKQTKAYDKKMSTLKTDAGREKATSNYNAEVIELEDILNKNEQVIRLLVQTLNTAANIKMNLWNGFKKSNQGYNTFYKSKSQGYIPADMEGVAMSDADGNIVKIVDRSTFSFANRSDDIESGFEHNESLEEEAAWVKNTVNKVQNSDKDPAVIATKEYHSHKKNKKPMKGAVISSTPGLVGAIGESLTEDVNKTAVLAFGRMNPPTVGHQKMVDTMAQAANKHNADPKLYLSHTQDSKKNPLSYEQKIEYAKKAFGDKVEVVESPAKTIMHVLVELYEQGYNNLIYIGGEDRIGGDEDITATISKYNGNPEENPKALYNFNNIEFINAGGRNANSNDFLETVSASMVRELVRNNDFDTFKKTVPFDEDTAAQLFNDIKSGLGIKEALMTEASSLTKAKYTPDVQKRLNKELKAINPKLQAPDPNKSLDDYRYEPKNYRGLFVKQGTSSNVSFSKSDITNLFNVDVLNAIDNLTLDIDGKDYELYNSGDKLNAKKGVISGAIATYYQEAIDSLLLIDAIKYSGDIIDYLNNSDPEAGTGVFEYISQYPGLNMNSFKGVWPNFVHDWGKNFRAISNNEDFLYAANSVLEGDVRRSIILHTGINNEYQQLAKQILSGNDKLDKSDVYYYLTKYKKYLQKDINTLVSLKGKPKDYVEYIQSISDRLIGVSLKKVDGATAQIDFDIPEKDNNYFTGKFGLIGGQRSFHLVFETTENGEERLDIRPAGGKSIKMEFRQKGKAANGSAAGPIKAVLGDEIFANIRLIASKGDFEGAARYLALVLSGKKVELNKPYKLTKSGKANITAIFNLASGFAATDVEGNRITAPYIKVH